MMTMMWNKVVWTTVMFTACAWSMVLGPYWVEAGVSLASVQLEDAGMAPVRPVADRIAPPNPKLVKLPFSFPAGMENTPVIYRGRLLPVQNGRSTKRDEQEQADLTEMSFCACPALRYCAPYYYVIYGIECDKGLGKHYRYQLPTSKYVAALARSKDLVTWDVSPCRGPMLDPIQGEGINNTDADLFEYQGNTYIDYGTGDQATWGTIRVAMYPGPMKEMFEAHFPEGVPTIKLDARQRRSLHH